ncbi:hypothetical protein D1007_09147 [Hordeum vulgare]|nr:hypothetical protein D1007_09147 [Hordeum vulgare]
MMMMLIGARPPEVGLIFVAAWLCLVQFFLVYFELVPSGVVVLGNILISNYWILWISRRWNVYFRFILFSPNQTWAARCRTAGAAGACRTAAAKARASRSATQPEQQLQGGCHQVLGLAGRLRDVEKLGGGVAGSATSHLRVTGMATAGNITNIV